MRLLATCAALGIACGSPPARAPQLSNAAHVQPTRAATLGAFAATIPTDWAVEGLTSDTQAARFRVKRAELVVLTSGEYEVSGIDWFARWREPFVTKDPRVIEVVPGALKTRVMRVRGDYFDAEVNAVRPDHAMIVALVESHHDRHYFKLVGPRADVVASEAAFRAMLASLKPL